jgi:hypothetical protein
LIARWANYRQTAGFIIRDEIALAAGAGLGRRAARSCAARALALASGEAAQAHNGINGRHGNQYEYYGVLDHNLLRPFAYFAATIVTPSS